MTTTTADVPMQDAPPLCRFLGLAPFVGISYFQPEMTVRCHVTLEQFNIQYLSSVYLPQVLQPFQKRSLETKPLRTCLFSCKSKQHVRKSELTGPPQDVNPTSGSTILISCYSSRHATSGTPGPNPNSSEALYKSYDPGLARIPTLCLHPFQGDTAFLGLKLPSFPAGIATGRGFRV